MSGFTTKISQKCMSCETLLWQSGEIAWLLRMQNIRLMNILYFTILFPLLHSWNYFKQYHKLWKLYTLGGIPKSRTNCWLVLIDQVPDICSVYDCLIWSRFWNVGADFRNLLNQNKPNQWFQILVSHAVYSKSWAHYWKLVWYFGFVLAWHVGFVLNSPFSMHGTKNVIILFMVEANPTGVDVSIRILTQGGATVLYM